MPNQAKIIINMYNTNETKLIKIEREFASFCVKRFYDRIILDYC